MNKERPYRLERRRYEMQRITAFAAINNVFDREPPTAPSVAGNGNFILFDPIGRSYKVGMRAKF